MPHVPSSPTGRYRQRGRIRRRINCNSDKEETEGGKEEEKEGGAGPCLRKRVMALADPRHGMHRN